MPLTQSEAARVEQLAVAYETSNPKITFAEFIDERAGVELRRELEDTLQELGDTAALEQLHAAPVRIPTGPQTEADFWAEYDAPIEGGPWALTQWGEWREVDAAALPGEAIEAQGRSIYLPPEHPSVRIAETDYGGNTDPSVRWRDQKFRAATAAVLQRSDPFYQLFFRAAPRGGNLGAGRAFQDTPQDYTSEGGEIFPFLEPSDPEAARLNNWWRRQTFDTRFGYPRGMTLNWLRVYTGPDGYRKYRAWAQSEVNDFFTRWYLADAGYVCTPEEINEAIGDTLNEQRERQGAQTEGDYSVHWPWIIGPLSQCSVPSRRRRMETLRKAAAIAAVVAGGIWAAPKIVPFFKSLGTKVAGALESAVGGAVTGAVTGERQSEAEIDEARQRAEETLRDPETQAAIERGEIPPPPTDPEDPHWIDYAVAIAEGYMQRQLREQQEQLARRLQQSDPGSAEQRALEAELRRLQQEATASRAYELAREIQRIRDEALRSAAGERSTDEAAEDILAAGAAPNYTPLVVVGAGALVLTALFRQR